MASVLKYSVTQMTQQVIFHEMLHHATTLSTLFLLGLWPEPVWLGNLDKLINLQVIIQTFHASLFPSSTDGIIH